MTRFAAVRRPLAMVAMALVASICGIAPAPASALPGDPPIESRSPADGAVLAPDPAGIGLAFTCPTYRFTDAGGGFALFAGRENYSVRVATAATLDADGRLAAATTVDQASASADLAQSGACTSVFADGSTYGPHTKPGTYYWQVARICADCGGYEVGPVRSFRIAVTSMPTVTTAWKPWSGHGVVVNVAAGGVPDGAAVVVQQRRAGAWIDRAPGAVSGGAATIDVVLPKAGSSALRAVVTVGDQRLEGTPLELRVRSTSGAARVTSRRDDGRWTGSSSAKAKLSFTVRGNGSQIAALTGKVTALCPAAVPGQFIPQLVSFGIPAAKVAPDGRFLTTRRSADGKLVVRVAGRLKGGRVKDGQIRWTDSLCTGEGTFTARR